MMKRQQATNKPLVKNVTSFKNGHQQTMRRSTRKKRQPDYLNDYEVEINNCSETSCFLTKALTAEEPINYNKAKAIQIGKEQCKKRS